MSSAAAPRYWALLRPTRSVGRGIDGLRVLGGSPTRPLGTNGTLAGGCPEGKPGTCPPVGGEDGERSVEG